MSPNEEQLIAATSKAEAPRLVYTVKEAAMVLNVSEKTIRRFLERGILTSSTALRKRLIPCKQVGDFLKATCPPPFCPLVVHKNA
jgi:excisionase family DNA binding protein